VRKRKISMRQIVHTVSSEKPFIRRSQGL
jgi:hypothetical protein